MIEDPLSPATVFANSPAIAKPDTNVIIATLNKTFAQAGVAFVKDTALSGTHAENFDTNQDGLMSTGEYTNNIPFAASKYASDVQVFFIKHSGFTYPGNSQFMARGASSTFTALVPYRDVVLFVADTLGYLNTAIAHEVGHKLGLSVNPGGSDSHDDPSYALAVQLDWPDNIEPPILGGYYMLKPNRAIMQSGAPIGNLLTWTYGLWMKHEDMKAANINATEVKQ